MTINHQLLLILKAKKSNVKIHKHSAFQIVFTEDYPFHSTIENKKHLTIYGFVIKPQVAHSCECSESNLIILNIEPYSFLGKLIATKLGNSTSAIFSSIGDFQQFFDSSGNEAPFHSLIKTINQNQDTQNIDKRIQQSISFINDHFKLDTISTQEIANQVFLSPSRLAALFKQQIGSSISKYILWTRLKNAIYLILTERDKALTAIALESGFYDSSQMNKYMYQLFGISPSKLKQKSDLIQFLDVEPS